MLIDDAKARLQVTRIQELIIKAQTVMNVFRFHFSFGLPTKCVNGNKIVTTCLPPPQVIL